MEAMLDAGETADPFLRVHAVNVYVKDQERSLRFFLDTLGFRIAFDARVESGQRLLAVAPPDGTAVLTLIEPPRNSLQRKLIGRATQVVFVTENLPATYREWRRRGVRFRSTPRLRRVTYEQAEAAPPTSATELPMTTRHQSVWGGTFARFEDVDRNSFALVSYFLDLGQERLGLVIGDIAGKGMPRGAVDGQPAGQCPEPVRHRR